MSRLLAVIIILLASSSHAATFTVTSSADSGPGTLRQAILDANANPGRDRIELQTDVSLAAILPEIKDPVDIDGNDGSGGRHSVTLPELDGSMLQFASGSNGSTIRNTRLVALFVIFVDPVFDVVIASNTVSGTITDSGYSTLIGGTTPAEGNTFEVGSDLFLGDAEGAEVFNNDLYLVSSVALSATIGRTGMGNTIGDRLWTTSVQTTIEGNTFVGTGPYSIRAFIPPSPPPGAEPGLVIAENQISGSTVTGILVEATTNITIRDNVISGHTTGIGIATSTGVLIEGNRIFGNGIAIDLNRDGITPNDPAPDADTGANDLQNYPVLTSATLLAGSLTVNGTLTSAPLTQYAIELFSDDAGDNEARVLLTRFNVTTDAAGIATFTQSLTAPAGVDANDVVTATATNLTTDDTSELSAPAVIAVASHEAVPTASEWALIALAAMLALLGWRASMS